MNKNEIVSISIGKCAGNTVNKTLRKMNYNLSIKHIVPVNYNPNKKYIILIRNPISRIISAFNWRLYNVCKTKLQESRFKGEQGILNKYKTINKLAEDLYNSDGSINISISKPHFYIHHLYEDINFYIGNFLNECSPENIYGVIVTETINEDLNRLFNVDINDIPHYLKNKKYDTSLSELGYNNLKKYLHKDYECINKMYNMDIITKKQYDILSV
jgi:hypothetical protein